MRTGGEINKAYNTLFKLAENRGIIKPRKDTENFSCDIDVNFLSDDKLLFSLFVLGWVLKKGKSNEK